MSRDPCDRLLLGTAHGSAYDLSPATSLCRASSTTPQVPRSRTALMGRAGKRVGRRW